MNVPRILNYGNAILNKCYQCSPVYKAIGVKSWCLQPSSFFSSVCQRPLESNNRLTLSPQSHLVECSRGLKYKMQLQLRCKDCYYVRKDGIWHVMCSSYGRHKQKQITKKEKYTWKLTFGFQSKQRPW